MLINATDLNAPRTLCAHAFHANWLREALHHRDILSHARKQWLAYGFLLFWAGQLFFDVVMHLVTHK